MDYLSAAPERLREVVITGGLPLVLWPADGLYRIARKLFKLYPGQKVVDTKRAARRRSIVACVSDIGGSR
jgi:hypothetical protein